VYELPGSHGGSSGGLLSTLPLRKKKTLTIMSVKSLGYNEGRI